VPENGHIGQIKERRIVRERGLSRTEEKRSVGAFMTKVRRVQILEYRIS